MLDEVLSKQALAALLRFAREATVWHDPNNGYLGAYFEEGWTNPLLLQLVEELRFVFPAIVGDLPLEQMWAYKYDQSMDGIDIHADHAKVNLNLWITPDDASLDGQAAGGDGGGMTVWLKEPPSNWEFAQFNGGDHEEMEEFVRGSAYVTVPYKQNRAVMFKSSLLHRTNPGRWKPGYLNRRINLTFLFGSI